MYEYLRGMVSDIREDYFVIDINGMGFKITTSRNSTVKIEEGEIVKVFTRLIVRDDSVNMYGFINKNELELFKLLTTVSGVGPKAAISLLSNLKSEEIIIAIATKNAKELTIAQGIGKKLAERIILELKDKINIDAAAFEAHDEVEDGNIAEVIEALTSLGYNYSEARETVLKIKDNKKPVDILIKEALKQLSRIKVI